MRTIEQIATDCGINAAELSRMVNSPLQKNDDSPSAYYAGQVVQKLCQHILKLEDERTAMIGAEQMSRNVSYLIDMLNEAHRALCPKKHGTWQQRAEQLVAKAKGLARELDKDPATPAEEDKFIERLSGGKMLYP